MKRKQKGAVGMVKGRRRREGHSSGFFNWSADNEEDDQSDRRSWTIADKTNSSNQSTFELLIEKRAEMKREQRRHGIPPADGPSTTTTKKRQAIYPTVITTINRILPIDRVNSNRNHDTVQCHKQSRTYSKFKPIACSTPKLQTPILSIWARQSSYKPRSINSQNRQPLERSQELLTNIFESVKCSIDKELEESTKEIAGLKQNISWQLVTQSPPSDPINLGQTLNESINLIPLSAPNSVPRSDHIIASSLLPSTELTKVVSFPEELIDKTLTPLQPEKDVSNQDLFEPDTSCNYQNLQANLDSPRSEDEESPHFIPFVMVTSYKEESAMENIIEDSPFTQPTNLISESESQRSKFLTQIEGIVFKVIKSLNRNNEIDPSILTFQKSQFSERLRECRANTCLGTIAKTRYGEVFYVLGEVYKMLRIRSTCNKRELYYRNVDLCGSYQSLSTAVDTVCNVLGCAPWELGIVSTSKSMIAGPLKISNADGNLIDFAEAMSEGMPLPNDFHCYHFLQTTAKFVLLVEKETVFKRLIFDDIFSRIGYEFLLITGRGQGDLAIRMCLSRLANECGIPIFGLFDADPYGIEILLTYKCGSARMVRKSDVLTVPSIKWIGVYPSEIEALNMVKLPLSGGDNKKINDILKRRYLSEDVAHQLGVAKDIKAKAEIEGLYDVSDNYLIDQYLANKIKHHLSVV